MRFIENVNKPIKHLHTANEVERWMDREVKDLEKKVIRTVKVLGLFFDVEEMEEEID